uniref:Mycin-5 n=1 Tax=Caenorhabditis remanei TaxID=31234 RepID=I6MRK7_CAERE|nr:mycin-5 precursor [Caenorhabditis remanei]
MKFHTLLYVLVLLAVFSTMVLADVKSGHYKGPCYHDENCNGVCRDEGYKSGHCSRWGGACWCDT